MLSNYKIIKLIVLIFAAALILVNSTVTYSDIDQIQKLSGEGKLDEALDLTNQELVNDKTNVTYRFLKGLILTRMENLEEARDVFIEITNTNPDLPEPYNNLAVIYASLGDYGKARELLEQAINTHPAYATAHENIGDIYAKLASQAYNQALELDKDNNMARAKLSLVNDLFSLPKEPAPELIAEAKQQPQIAAIQQPPVVEPEPEVAPQIPEPQLAERREPVEQVPLAVMTQNQESQSSISLIKQTVLEWATAWSRQDLNDYLSFYADDFSPADGRTLEQWRQIRRQRISSPRSIQVLVSDLVVDMLGLDHAQVTFTQVYNSPGYSDRVKKNLLFKQVQNSWRITQEQTQ
jgi:tetratricopeptide (TPR) repeat protein